jgi:hypothetical protein
MLYCFQQTAVVVHGVYRSKSLTITIWYPLYLYLQDTQNVYWNNHTHVQLLQSAAVALGNQIVIFPSDLSSIPVTTAGSYRVFAYKENI